MSENPKPASGICGECGHWTPRSPQLENGNCELRVTRAGRRRGKLGPLRGSPVRSYGNNCNVDVDTGYDGDTKPGFTPKRDPSH